MLSLALWLEVFISTNAVGQQTPFIFAFSDSIEVPTGGVRSKDFVQKLFGTNVFRRQEFGLIEGRLGSYSIRKYGSTHVRICGATKDEKDIRGRWRSGSRVSDVYDDVELPYPNPDAKVAEMMTCIGGFGLTGEQNPSK
jgi:hypothetical protein